MNEISTDCRQEVGITVSLVDSLITISRVLAPRLDEIPLEVREALLDLYDDRDFQFIQRALNGH